MSATLTSTGFPSLRLRKVPDGARKDISNRSSLYKRDDGLPGGDLGERFDLDAGDGAGERGEQLAAVKGVACQLHLPACLIELRSGAEQGGLRLVERGLRRDPPF